MVEEQFGLRVDKKYLQHIGSFLWVSFTLYTYLVNVFFRTGVTDSGATCHLYYAEFDCAEEISDGKIGSNPIMRMVRRLLQLTNENWRWILLILIILRRSIDVTIKVASLSVLDGRGKDDEIDKIGRGMHDAIYPFLRLSLVVTKIRDNKWGGYDNDGECWATFDKGFSSY